jgi:hypothetical protein
MKMAKASELDLSNAMEICQSLESMTHNFYPSVPSGCAKLAEGEESEELDLDNLKQCQRILRHLIRHEIGLARVVYGCAVMLDPSNEPPMAKALVWVGNHAGIYTVQEHCGLFHPRLQSNWQDIAPRCITMDAAKAACEAHHQVRWLEQMA